MLNDYLKDWKWSNMFYSFFAKLQSIPHKCVCSLVSQGMYVNPTTFKHVLWRVEGDFVVVGVGKDIGWLWQIAFKTLACGKIGIQLPCGVEGVSHGEVCALFESTRNFVEGLACDRREFASPNNDEILLQHQEKEGDSKWNHGFP